MNRVASRQIIDKSLFAHVSADASDFEKYMIKYTKHKMVEKLIDHIPWRIEYVDNTIKLSYDLMIDEYKEFVTHWKEIKNTD